MESTKYDTRLDHYDPYNGKGKIFLGILTFSPFGLFGFGRMYMGCKSGLLKFMLAVTAPYLLGVQPELGKIIMAISGLWYLMDMFLVFMNIASGTYRVPMTYCRSKKWASPSGVQFAQNLAIIWLLLIVLSVYGAIVTIGKFQTSGES